MTTKEMVPCEGLELYKKIKAKHNSDCRAQAKYFRDEEGIDSVEKGIEYMRTFLPDQVYKGGVMEGRTGSVMLTCAILGEAIEPNTERPIAMTHATHGWDIYHGLRKAGIW